MNFDIKQLYPNVLRKLKPLMRYSLLSVILIFLFVYGLMVFRINQLTSIEPSEDQIAEKLKGATRPKIDQKAVDAMLNLEDRSVEVKAIFNQARQNPFDE
ncbi:MAG: hypothetical protein AAB459_02845 [Patescibacteria group bacterium]